MKIIIKPIVSSVLVATLLSGCSFAPKLEIPKTPGAEKFKEASIYESYWEAGTKDAGQVDRTNWWTVFNDAQLNALEQEAMAGNPSLQAAAARVDQSSATLTRVRSNLFPKVDLNTGFNGQDLGDDQKPVRSYYLLGSVSYGVDVFGRVRAASRAAKLDKKEAEALRDQVLLLLQADVAQNYFILLSLDTEIDLLQQTVGLRDESMKLVEKRFKEGEANEQETLRAKAELATTRAELAGLQQQRATFEHALAILLGKTPSEFTAEARKLPTSLPIVPAGLPSSVLERRPDIAAAQFDMAAANERIGLARAAFFPSITLTGQGGLASPDLGNVFNWSSRSWLLGPAATLPIFNGGARIADVQLANAAFKESTANYRQKVLVAFKEVEDNLSSLRLLAIRADELYQAAEAAKKAGDISQVRYREGESSYLEVLDTQRDTLAAQRAYTQTQGQRFATTINLIRALGGGWAAYTPVQKAEPAERKEVPIEAPQAAEKPATPAQPQVQPQPEPVQPQAPIKTEPQQLQQPETSAPSDPVGHLIFD